MCRKTLLAIVAILGFVTHHGGCADESPTDPTPDASSAADAASETTTPPEDTGEFCMLGEADCACTLNQTCNDAGYTCVDGVCVEDAGGTCGPTALCTRSIDECDAQLTLDSCTGWYEGLSEPACRDMAAYTACNCECFEYPDCDTYFACGNLCFNDHCK